MYSNQIGSAKAVDAKRVSSHSNDQDPHLLSGNEKQGFKEYNFFKNAKIINEKKDYPTNLPMIKCQSVARPAVEKPKMMQKRNTTILKDKSLKIRTNTNDSKLGSELSIPGSKKKDNTMLSAHDVKLTYLNEISPLGTFPRAYCRKINADSKEAQ